MKSFLLSSVVLALALASTAAARDLAPAERAALAGQPPTNIATLRAGAADATPAVSVVERKTLTDAAGSAQGLDALRAGDADDHDLTVVGVVVGVVVLAILIF